MQTATVAATNGTVTNYEPLILDAIKEGFRTLGGIKRKSGFPVHKDISELLNGMIADKKIHRQDNGTVTAYFLWEEKPIRFWLDGDGRVEAEFGLMTPKAKKPEPAKANDATSELDPAVVEQLACEGLTAKQAAERLGMPLYNFKNRIASTTGKNKAIRDAWYRGRSAGPVKQKASRPAKAKLAKRNVARATEVKATPEVVKQEEVKPVDGPVHSRHVTLSKGGQVLIGYSGNVFDMTAKEMELISGLNALLQGFEG